MKVLRRFWKRFAGSLGGGRRREAELAEEIESHVAMLTEENLRRGMSPVEARREALITFGGVETAKEGWRDQRGFAPLGELRQDARYALRGMRRNPVFTSVILACLGLGVGANTAVFSLVNAVLIRALPVSEPDGLVFFEHRSEGDTGAVRHLSSGYGDYSLPYPTFEALRDGSRSLESVFAFASLGIEGNSATVTLDGRALTTDAEMVTGAYFSAMGGAPAAGRLIDERDLDAASPAVVVIGYGFWRREFGGDPRAVGRAITINGQPFTIAGVAPARFKGLTQGSGPELWIPLRYTPGLAPWGSMAAAGPAIFTDRKYWWSTIGARRREGVSNARAQKEAEALFHQSITAGMDRIPPNLPRLTVTGVSPAIRVLRNKLAGALRILSATAALVLLIAFVNMATLLTARARARRREIGVRLAMGASRARLVRQLLTESLLLAFAGGALGLLFARWGGPILVTLITGGRPNGALDAGFDWTVLAFNAAVSFATGILFGLIPALGMDRDLAPQLKDGSPNATARRSLARILVASQIALSAMLLFGAGLFVRTLRNLEGQNLGFRSENLLLFEVDPERSGHKGADGMAVHQRLLERIQVLPGVVSASFSQIALLTGWSNTSPGAAEGAAPLPAGQPDQVYWNRVGPDFFETMGIRVRLGRGIERRDTNRPAAVVNEAWTRTFFTGQNPIGRHVSSGRDFNPERAYEIVGVAEDAKYDRMREAAPRTVYISYGAPWDRARRLCYAVRARGDSAALAAALRAAVREIAPNMPVMNLRTQAAQIEEALALERMLARIATFVGALALLLVAAGVYGTLSHAVAQRTGEIGIRMALGARRGAVVWLVLRESLVAAGAGLLVGLPGAIALAGLASSALFGVTNYDGVAIGGTVILVAAIVVASGLLPANRASKIDPIRALRHE